VNDVLGSDFRDGMEGGGESNIMVTVRVRPLLDMDVKKENIVSVLDQKVIVVTDPGHQSDFKPGTNYLTSGKTKEKRYVLWHRARGGISYIVLVEIS